MARKRTDAELADAPQEMPSELETLFFGEDGTPPKGGRKRTPESMIQKMPEKYKKLTPEEKEKLRNQMMKRDKYRPQQLTDEQMEALKERISRPTSRAVGGVIDNKKMYDGGMAKGKGGKSYQHNYATGGSVVDHLKKDK